MFQLLFKNKSVKINKMENQIKNLSPSRLFVCVFTYYLYGQKQF